MKLAVIQQKGKNTTCGDRQETIKRTGKSKGKDISDRKQEPKMNDAYGGRRNNGRRRLYMMGVPEPYMAPSSSQAARALFFSDDLSDICDITSAEFFIF